MRVLNDGYENVPVDVLKHHPENPRKGDTVAIAESIAHNGFYGAVIAQRSTGYILAGNHRIEAAKATGASEVPVIWVDVDDEEAKRILLADNRTGDLADYNDDTLQKILRELVETPDGLAGTGFDSSFLEDDDTPEDKEVLLDQAVQLAPAKEYVVVMCESADEFEDLKVALELKQVRRGGYKVGSQFDAVGTERVVRAARLLEKLNAGRDTE